MFNWNETVCWMIVLVGWVITIGGCCTTVAMVFVFVFVYLLSLLYNYFYFYEKENKKEYNYIKKASITVYKKSCP